VFFRGNSISTEGFKRKLTAILSADVVGYSRLMRDDEEATIGTLNAHKKMIFNLIERNQGRLVDSTGDNLLAEFVSVVDAVRCAVQIQEDLKAKNEDLSENRKMEFRIGINTGDVVQEGDRIYGDGVNVAARIESLADAGGICISRSAYDQVKRKLNFKYEYLGEHQVKNIDEPVRVYKVLMESVSDEALQEERSEEPVSAERAAYSLSDKPSIVVLPFVNMSDDPKQEYFSDGMTEELIGALVKLEGLKVISRTSAFYFKGKDVDLRAIGEKLKVDHALEGSVRKAGNKLRISAQLIKVDDDTHLWAETYDRELEDVFAIQDEISQAVVENLKVKLLGKETEPLVKDYTKNTEAYELYLKGKYFEQKGFLTFDKAIDYMEKALQADPGLAPAYSKLAMTLFHKAVAFSVPSNEMWPKIKTLTLKALEIDEMDAEAHASLGLIKSLSEYNWIGAEIHFKRAIELNPTNSDAHFQYAQFLAGVGRISEAIEKMKRALEYDPVSNFSNAMLAILLYFARQFDKAITQSYKALELDENNHLAILALAMSHAAKGIYDEGIKMFQPVKKIPIIQAFIAYLYGKAGKREEAQKILENLLERSKHGYYSPFMIATIYISVGNHDKAFEWLEKAFKEHDTVNWCLKVEPMFDDLHSDPRWKILMEKMGLAD
jgi:adenylate cyclase